MRKSVNQNDDVQEEEQEDEDDLRILDKDFEYVPNKH